MTTKCEVGRRALESSEQRLINVGEASRFLGISIATFWRRVADGTIPRPIKLGGSSRWQVCDLTDAVDRARQASHPVVAPHGQGSAGQ